MPVPARRKSNASVRRGRNHFALKKTVTSACPKCAAPIKPHNACLSCGFYRDHSTAKVEKVVAKVVKKAKETPKKK